VESPTFNVPAYTGREIASMTNEQPEWIAAPYVAKGIITEWAGKIKTAGKTTFASYLCRSVLRKEPFLGRPTNYTKILYVTEQSPDSFRQSIAKSGLLEHDDFYAMFAQDFREQKVYFWSDLTQVVGDMAHKLGADLIWFDTLMELAKVRDENDPSEATEKMDHIKALTDVGHAPQCIRHDRKSGGDVGESSRGSSNWGGQMDMMCQINRPEGGPTPKRELWAVGRLDYAPPFLMVQLGPKGYEVIATERDDASAASRPPRDRNETRVLMLLTTEWQTTGDLALGSDLSEPTIRGHMIRLAGEGRILQQGSGKRGDPLMWKLEKESSTPKRELSFSNSSEGVGSFPNGHAEDAGVVYDQTDFDA
jgi:hypothetical protein